MSRRPRTLSVDWTSQQSARVAVALVVQPFAAALLAFVTFPALEYSRELVESGHPGDWWDAALSVGVGAGMIGILVTALAVPVLVFLASRGPITRRQTLLSGAVLGNVPAALILTLAAASGNVMQASNAAFNFVASIIFGSLIGVGCATVFWVIAGRRLGASAETAPR